MAAWRFLRGWSRKSLRAQLERIASSEVNAEVPEELMTVSRGWRHWASESVVAPAPDDESVFVRARTALDHYSFSDPSIVTAHFDPAVPLLHRRMLLEIKVLGLRYLCPALVSRVRDDRDVHGFRYDTLVGHIERGVEWFVLTREPGGTIRFRIEARWQQGDLPNWWSRLGFAMLSARYQRRWHRAAHRRMSLLARYGSLVPPRRDRSGLAHQGPDVTFTFGKDI